MKKIFIIIALLASYIVTAQQASVETDVLYRITQAEFEAALNQDSGQKLKQSVDHLLSVRQDYLKISKAKADAHKKFLQAINQVEKELKNVEIETFKEVQKTELTKNTVSIKQGATKNVSRDTKTSNTNNADANKVKEALKEVDKAIDEIKQAGNDFVKTIRDGGSKAEIEAAQIAFLEKAQEALDKYDAASQAGADSETLAQLQEDIQNAINTVQSRAAEAMRER